MDKILKVCIIGSAHWSAFMGGIEYQEKLLIEKLKNEEKICIFFITNNLGKNYLPEGYNVIEIGTNKKLSEYGSFFGIFRLYKILYSICPDVIYQKGASALISAAALYSRRFGSKIIWHFSSDRNVVIKEKISKIFQFNRYIENKLFQYGIKNAHEIIVQTNFQKLAVKKFNQKARLHLIRNFHPFHDGNDLKKKKNQVVWVGNFKRLKQPELFIELSKTLWVKNMDIKCIMIGAPTKYPNGYQKILEKKIKEVPNLEWLGKLPIDIVNKKINESTILVNTSKWEGFPNTYIQAWMRGIPVVTLNCDPDNIIHNFGIGLNSGSYEKLVDDVINLLKNHDRRLEMGKKAKKYAMANHSLNNLDKLIKIITSVRLKWHQSSKNYCN
jgi:glycosyltransferase involved in cell wall biosynthesis